VAAERQHHNVTLAILVLAGTAYSLSSTIVVPALPTLQRDLHTTTTWATWVLTSFLLVASVATPILGKLGDQYGKERLLVVALACFLGGCIGSAAAWNIWSLIGFRAVQGAAGAIFPLSFSIIRDEFPAEKVGVAIGTMSAVFGVGGGAGILSAGLVVDNLSWRWIFIGSSFVIALALLLVTRFVPESPIKTPSRVDLVGALLLSAALVSLLLALTEANRWGWLSARTLGLFGGAAALLVAWVAAELRVSEPLVDMHVFRQRPVLLTNGSALIAGFAMFGTFVLLPQFMETPRGLPASAARLVDYGFGASVTKAGLYLLPSSFTLLFAGPVAAMIGRRRSMKWPLAIGLAIVSAVGASFALWHDHPWQIWVQQVFMGVGVGFAFAAMATLITQAVRVSETGIATGMNTVMRTVGSVIGAQLAAALLGAYTIDGTELPSVTGFEVSFWVAAGVGLAGAALALFVTPVRRPRRPGARTRTPAPARA
jgi:EmrB/QacA subfamily drug resistance transporter